ncbi:hypothetical protein B0H13DRAFT_577988 [Mycena leptocephala]|nr:hypothetical protein B0H13DRAFT_577988 [Mycena leptocephala]
MICVSTVLLAVIGNILLTPVAAGLLPISNSSLAAPLLSTVEPRETMTLPRFLGRLRAIVWSLVLRELTLAEEPLVLMARVDSLSKAAAMVFGSTRTALCTPNVSFPQRKQNVALPGLGTVFERVDCRSQASECF